MPLPPACPWIDYYELDYLTQVDDRERAETISSRLDSVGIPVCVQTVTVRTEARRTNHTYRFYVPAEHLELARWVAFEEPASDDRLIPLPGGQIDALSSSGKPLAGDQHAASGQAIDE